MRTIAPPPRRKPVPPKPIGDPPPELSSTLSLRRMSSHFMITHSFQALSRALYSRLHDHELAGACAIILRDHGSTTVGERRTSARHRVEGSHCAHRDLEEPGAGPMPGGAFEFGRRRSR